MTRKRLMEMPPRDAPAAKRSEPMAADRPAGGGGGAAGESGSEEAEEDESREGD